MSKLEAVITAKECEPFTLFSCSGKSKNIMQSVPHPHVGQFVFRDDVTAKDGERHRLIDGIRLVRNAVNRDVFELLCSRGFATAYYGICSKESYLAPLVRMVPDEVVARFVCQGSFAKCNPHIPAGTVLQEPVIEHYFKTSGGKAGDIHLPCNDPKMTWDRATIYLWRPNMPLKEQSCPLAQFAHPDVHLFDLMSEMHLLSSQLLRKLLAQLSADLQDIKGEYGVTPEGWLVRADVVTPDEWRLIYRERSCDKDPFRKAREVTDEVCRDVLEGYKLAASLTNQFKDL